MQIDATIRPPRLYFTEAGLEALRRMIADRHFADPEKFAHIRKLASLMQHRLADKSGPKVSDLTPRGGEVLAFMAEGLSDDEVAAKLDMGRNTVRNHISAIYRVVGVRRRTALVVWARERGLGTPHKTTLKRKSGKAR